MENGPTMAKQANSTDSAHRGARHSRLASGFIGNAAKESCQSIDAPSALPKEKKKCEASR